MTAGARALGLPVRSARDAWLGAGSLLVYYLSSMARDLGVLDSPELALVAVERGRSHPLGQPLHALLGWVVTRVPGVDPLLLLNALSAVFGALAVVPAMSLAEGWARGAGPGLPSARRTNFGAWVLVLSGVHAALWESATRIEVYSLASFFALWAVARAAALLGEGAVGAARGVLAAGIALGLAAAANPHVAVFGAVVVGPALLLGVLRRRLPVSIVPAAVAGGAIGLLPYLHVLLAASPPESFAWGDLSTGEGLRHYLLGLDYTRNRALAGEEWLAHVLDWLAWAGEAGLLIPLVFGAVAAVTFAVLRRGLALAGIIATGLALAVVSWNSVWEPAIPDYVSYFHLGLWLLAAAVAALAEHLADTSARAWMPWAMVVVVAALACVAAPAPWARTRHGDRVARDLTMELLETVPENGVLVAEASHWVAPLLYLQRVERVRPDVVVVPVGFASTSWYWGLLRRQHPALAPFDLRGPGGRVGRLARLLAANPGRAIRFTTAEEAGLYGRPVCGAGLAYAVGRDCGTRATARPWPAALLRAWADAVGAGSPTTDGMLAAVALERGRFLVRTGQREAGAKAMLAGITTAAASHPGPPPPPPRHHPPISDPTQNLREAQTREGHAGRQIEK